MLEIMSYVLRSGEQAMLFMAMMLASEGWCVVRPKIRNIRHALLPGKSSRPPSSGARFLKVAMIAISAGMVTFFIIIIIIMHLLFETENLFAQLIVGPAATVQRQIDVALIPYNC